MSTDSAYAHAIHLKEHDLSQIVLSRKRKLCELYAVTATAEPIPPLFDFNVPNTNESLAAFLESNDLQRGRYFHEFSLPPRAFLQQPPKTAHLSPSVPEITQTLGDAAPPPDDAEDGVLDVEQTSEEEPRCKLVDGATPSPSLAVPQGPDTPDDSRSSDAETTADAQGPGPARLDTALSTSPQVHRKGKPAQPESPPYSPGTAAARMRLASSSTESSQQAPPSVLTPRRDEHDRDAPTLTPRTTASRQRHDATPEPVVSQKTVHPAVRDCYESEASRIGRPPPKKHSRVEVTPPATSPEDDEGTSQKPHEARQTSPMRQFDSKPVPLPALIENELQTGQETSKGTEQVAGPTLSDITAVGEASDRGPLRPRRANSAVDKSSRYKGPKSFSIALTKKSERRTKFQKELLSLATQPRRLVSYYKPVITSDAFNNHHGKDLKSLVDNRIKVLSTVEREVALREDRTRLVLTRVKHLQHQGRWSLRQQKPADEPPSPANHWDDLITDVRWMRTDFREERKLKLSVARMLAELCAEYVAADSEVRERLSVGAAVPPALAKFDFLTTMETSDDTSSHILQTSDRGTSNLGFLTDFTLPLDDDLLQELPIYGPPSLPMDDSRAAAGTGTPWLFSDSKNGLHSDEDDNAQPLDALEPDDTTCALFADGGKPQLRRKMNVTNPFKPPNRNVMPMPTPEFLFGRAASQWTAEDDDNLRQNIRQTPANWFLISQVMAPKSEFFEPVDRRTPWECFERFINLDWGPTQDMQLRPYLKPFLIRREQAKRTYEDNQRHLHAQIQQARDNGQPAPNMVNKPFPDPKRAERRHPRRFMALLDAARRLARKRETTATKQERHQQTESRPSQRPTGLTQIPRDPRYFSMRKYEQEQKEAAADLHYQQQQKQKALQEAQRRQQAGYPASLSHGIGQQMQSGMASNAAPSTNSHLAVPAMQRYGARQGQQGANAQSVLPNGVAGRGQVSMQGRAQTGVSLPRPGPGMSQEQMAMYMQQQAAHLRQQNAQHGLQSQATQQQGHTSHASPPQNQAVPYTNAQLNGDSHHAGNADSASSPKVQQGSNQQHAGPHSSPHAQQALAVAAGQVYLPQALSSGQVPRLVALEHQIQQRNPGMSAQDARQQATEQLKHWSRHNALNSAAGLTSPKQQIQQPNTQQQQQQQALHSMQAGGSQSPYQQHGVPVTSQMQQSPYQQNGVLASNHMNQQHASHAAYQNAMRKQMYQQQIHQMTPIQGGPSMVGASPSPHMGHMTGFVGPNNRTAGQMRPPSRSASGFEVPQYNAVEMQRAGSAASGAAQSPRPISAQGYGPQ